LDKQHQISRFQTSTEKQFRFLPLREAKMFCLCSIHSHLPEHVQASFVHYVMIFPRFNDDVQVLAISCDSPYVQRVFAEKEGYEFPVLSDFWPHGNVAKTYGVFEESKGCALRGSFLIDKEGILRWEVKNGWAARENADYKAAIAAL